MKNATNIRTLGLCLAAALALTGCGKAAEKTPPPSQGTDPSAALAPAAPSAADGETAVDVNGTKLTKGELNARVAQVVKRQGGGLPPEMRAGLEGQASQQVIEGFVAQQVLLQEAAKTNITVSAEEMEKAMGDIVKQLPPGVKLEEAVAQMGMTTEKVRYDLEADLRIRKLLDGHTASLPPVSEEEIGAFYKDSPQNFAMPESVHVRHILLSADENADAAAKAQKREKAEALRKQIEGGADFAQIAKDNSDCPSKDKGGDLGELTRGRAVKPFEDAAFSQEVNALGPVVETEFGYHIIQVLEKKEARTIPLAEVHDKIATHLGNERKQKAVGEYVEALKGKAAITYAEPPAKAAPQVAP